MSQVQEIVNDTNLILNKEVAANIQPEKATDSVGHYSIVTASQDFHDQIKKCANGHIHPVMLDTISGDGTLESIGKTVVIFKQGISPVAMVAIKNKLNSKGFDILTCNDDLEALQDNPNLQSYLDAVKVSLWDKEQPKGKAKEPKEKTKWLVDGKEVRSRGAITWNLEGLLPHNSVGYIYGGRGSFKSFIAIDICAALIYGHDWRGYKNKVGKGRVLYIVAEGHAGFPARLTAICAKYGDWDEGAVKIVEKPVNMSIEDHVTEILEESDHLNNPFTAVVIDTLSRVSGGVDKNGNEIMKVLANIDRFKTPKTTVIILAHPPKGKSDTISGAFDQEGAADFMFNITRAPQPSMNTKVQVQKQKDGEDGTEFDLTLKKVLVEEAHDLNDKDKYSLVIEDDYEVPKELNTMGKILLEIQAKGPISLSDLSKNLCLAHVPSCDKSNLLKKLTKDKTPAKIPEGKTKNDYYPTSLKEYIEVLTTNLGNATVYRLNSKGIAALEEIKKAHNWITPIKMELSKEDQELADAL